MGSVLLIAGALSRNVNVGKKIVPTITLLAKVDNTKGTKTLNPRKTKHLKMFHIREDGQGRHLPQPASSPPQGPNTLHIYIGARDAANTIQPLSFFLFKRSSL